MHQSFQIAIDGPVAAGKGTVARLVAERLGFLYVDTGAMYRVTALVSQRAGIDWSQEEAVAAMIAKTDIQLRRPTEDEKDGRLSTVLVDGEDVSWKIRTEEMSRGSSIVAGLRRVREELVKKQQIIAQAQNVVMEGRDITFRVLPEAKLKIYLTADPEERAKRRHAELLMRGQDISFEEVLQELKDRDIRDMQRAVDPLQVVDGAWVLDTTGLSIDEVVDRIEEKVNQLKRG